MGGWIRGNVAWVALTVAFAALLWSEPAWASTRVTLVVGNGSYDPKHAPELLNPVNDARLMARSLETSGFEVQLVTDADQAAMKKAIKMFGKRLVEAGGDTVGLFYFAGHGVEDRGQNYLIPLGAEIESEVDFHTDAVLIDWVLARMRKAGNRLNMVILDACRNNPFEGRYRGASQGLAQMDAPLGSLIAYAAAPRQVAFDGEGENSPYTAALAEEQIGMLENAVTPPAPTPEEVEAVLGLERTERRQIQIGLASLGFDPGPADGLFGQRTREALGKWQSSQGEERTGHLNAEAARVLLAAGEVAERKRAAVRPGRMFRDHPECPEMMVVPAGSFMMGSPSWEEGRDHDEDPQHRVTIAAPFAVGRYEITWEEFSQFVEATDYSTGDLCCVIQDHNWQYREGHNWRNPGYQ